ncbi:MAG: phosphoribosylformylglycinamidine synthase subunit PurQ, partial [Oscillospiraceae bacterium]|nr:phosphoribosylformylglycinamidine synthase subunit PurQ [Oscillospiraceae bacterium]
LEATVVARVQAEPRLVMHWNGAVIVDLARSFLNSNGAEKHARAFVPDRGKNAPAPPRAEGPADGLTQNLCAMAGSLRCCSRRGLVERFDSTIGAGTVLMPFGGKHQRTPAQVTAAKIPLLQGETDTASVMSYGFDPYRSEADPYRGAYFAVVESVAKLAAAGCPLDQCYLTFQEYFERMTGDPLRWGKPLAALLGAMQAQLELGIASIGGKDSMSGSFEQINVPPTLVSFAVALCNASELISNEFKQPGSTLALLQPETDADGFPRAESLLHNFAALRAAIRRGEVRAAHALTAGGVSEALLKMALGNQIGVRLAGEYDFCGDYTPVPGDILLELAPGAPLLGKAIGATTEDGAYATPSQRVSLAALARACEARLEPVFPTQAKGDGDARPPVLSYPARSCATPAVRVAQPRVLIPVFPGTNCEYDSARAFERAGARAEIFVINNQSAQGLRQSVERAAALLAQAQILFLPGGFSGGDEPDGSGKFITAFFRSPRLREAVTALLEERGGLIGGICNGFQALIKLGLVPYGKICAMTPQSATLTFNTIGRHQSKLVRTRVASVLSPWLSLCAPGEEHLVPISHGEGRFLCPEALLRELTAKGQIATQYVDLDGQPSMEIQYNPNGSLCAAEGITSPDGRVFGKMGHSERVGRGLYINVPGETDNKMFASAVRYFA